MSKLRTILFILKFEFELIYKLYYLQHFSFFLFFHYYFNNLKYKVIHQIFGQETYRLY